MKNKPIYELGQHSNGRWWCRDKTRPGLLLLDDSGGNLFEFPQSALEACIDGSEDYDKLKKKLKGKK